jgi:hypothetical protein
MERSASSETKEGTTNSRLRAMDVGALTILRTFAPTNQKSRNDGGTPGPRAAWDKQP